MLTLTVTLTLALTLCHNDRQQFVSKKYFQIIDTLPSGVS